MAAGGAAQAEDAGEIDLEDVVPVVVAMRGGRLTADQPGVVDQDVDPAERRERLGHQAVGRRAIGEVGGEGDRAAAGALGNRVGGGRGRPFARVQHDLGARAGERDRHAGAESAGRAGHERDAAVEAEAIERHRRPAAGGRHAGPCHRFALAASSPEGIAAKSGWTLTTPYWRSVSSVCAAIIHRKLMEPPGAATFG